jgi:transcriptional regulator with XRE-family HTH domain/tetratricopeptide (TPR) repeat protein
MRNSEEDIKVLITVLRRLRGWSQGDLVERSGIKKSSISDYERGKQVPPRPVVEKLAATAQVPMWFVDGALVPVLALARRLLAGTEMPALEGEWTADDSDARGSFLDSLALAHFLTPDDADLVGDEGCIDPRTQELVGEKPAQVPATYGASCESDSVLVDFTSLVGTLCLGSERAAGQDPRQAFVMARLALQVADLVPGGEAPRSALQSKAWAFMGNARRVAADLASAEAAFLASRSLRVVAAEHANGPLPHWRLLDLEASLRKDQRRFPAALDLLERAWKEAPQPARGRILLNKASTLEQAGHPAESLATLAEAEPLLEASGTPRDCFGLRFNRVTCLWQLGQLGEAQLLWDELVAETRAVNDLDQLRLHWIGARLAADLGRRVEARTEYGQLKGEFNRRSNWYDAALVSLDIAILCCEEGKTAEAGTLAHEILETFSVHGIEREALAALRLLVEATAQQTATAELARQVRNCLKGGRAPSPLRMQGGGPSRRRRREVS